jgi:hypothetical protein
MRAEGSGIRDFEMKRHTVAIVLLGWALYWSTGSARGAGPFSQFPTEAACKAAGKKTAADAKVQEAKDTAAAEAEAKRSGETYGGTTIGYDVEWRCVGQSK